MTGLKKNLGFTHLARGIAAALLITQVTACGTLLYPERRGQTNGQIDIGVAALDAIGLLFFFVPGVVAFGVDFVTGAIYLPGGGMASLTEGELNKIKNGSDSIDVEKFKTVMAQRKDLELPKDIYTDQLNIVAMSSTQSLETAMSLNGQRVAFSSAY
ncbi:polyribonucleotide nucleotidyltransferase [Marinomonas foliarum]|uniref:Polyribonucleotide nucleotidyltransferase n=1 Tax=Marinomonas foliarum TaxID=491950 RepID=A0ABX7IPI4_9GAMM|nr:polyribonucleotide nucleotidyltransferase [Marinomonas foliarum]QRV23628.1 polyribonucleotide nucleotidyltransferase [Marinomonas foliarum]